MSTGIMTTMAEKANRFGNHLNDLFAETRDTLLYYENELLQSVPKKALVIGGGIVTGLIGDMCTQIVVNSFDVQNPSLLRLAGPVVGSLVGYMIDNMKDPDEDGEAPHLVWRAAYA